MREHQIVLGRVRRGSCKPAVRHVWIRLKSTLHPLAQRHRSQPILPVSIYPPHPRPHTRARALILTDLICSLTLSAPFASLQLFRVFFSPQKTEVTTKRLLHTAITFHHFFTVSLCAQNLPVQKILSSTLVCCCLSD